MGIIISSIVPYNKSFLFLSLEDITVIDNEWYIINNVDKLVNIIDDDNIVLETPIKTALKTASKQSLKKIFVPRLLKNLGRVIKDEYECSVPEKAYIEPEMLNIYSFQISKREFQTAWWVRCK